MAERVQHAGTVERDGVTIAHAAGLQGAVEAKAGSAKRVITEAVVAFFKQFTCNEFYMMYNSYKDGFLVIHNAEIQTSAAYSRVRSDFFYITFV